MKGFIKKEDSAVYPSEKVVFSLNKEGLLVETALYIKVIPHETKSFQLVGFMREIKHLEMPAFAFISMKSKNIEGVNQSFIDLVNRPIDFTNLSKDPISITTFLPQFEFKFSMQPGDEYPTQLTYNNSSDKML